MSSVEICPDCSARLPVNSPAGLCPRCLLRLGAALAVDLDAGLGNPEANRVHEDPDRKIGPAWPPTGVLSQNGASGGICLTNNAAERALRGLALGRKSWLFAGSQRGAERAAVMYTLIQTAKLHDIDPQAWLADVLARIADIPQTRLGELLPWNWRKAAPTQKAA